MKAIQKELGEGTEIQEEIAHLPGEAAQDPRCPTRSRRSWRSRSSRLDADAPGIGRDRGRPQLPRLDVRRCPGARPRWTTST
ncbi:MAG: hypothetical protein M0C28_48300 [Candidatus Moduliflexus flocculans]|nr:hypothetical protein [Candidatus Moduliflexus flocculans]